MSIALWCLFIAALLHFGSKMPLAVAQGQAPGGYDNNHPRDQWANLPEWGKRALAAHQNQIESFPFFAAGVLVAVTSGITGSIVDYLAIAFVVARIVYIALYIKNVATLRSLVWVVGFGCSLALMCSPAWA